MSPETPVPVPAAKRSWLTGRRLLWGVGIGFLALVVVGAFALFQAYRRADATLARHRARLEGEREALEALPRGRPALLEPVQAGDVGAVVDAFLAAVDRVPAAERLRLASFATDPVPAAGEDAVLAAHPEPIAALEPLLFVASAPPPLLGNPLVDSIWRYDPGMKWLAAAGTRLVARGAGQAALRVALLTAAYADEVTRRGTPIHRMYGLAYEGIATRRAAAALAAGRIDPDEARRLGRAFEVLERARLPLGTTLAFERMLFRATLCDPGADVARTLDNVARVGWRRLWPAKLRLAEVLDGLDSALDGMVAAVGTPSDDVTATIRRAEAAAPNQNEFLASSLAIWPALLRRDANGRARLRVVRTALAVAEWTARKGSLPGSLADLVPDFLPAVPLDPWDGKPLRYAAGKVWSIGQDGKDDGGTSPDPDSDDVGDLFAEVPPAK